MNFAQLIDFEKLESERERTRVPQGVPRRKAANAPRAPGMPTPRRPRGELRRAALVVLRDAPGISAVEFRKRMDAPAPNMNVLLFGLVAAGLARKTGEVKHYRYFITAAGQREC